MSPPVGEEEAVKTPLDAPDGDDLNLEEMLEEMDEN